MDTPNTASRPRDEHKRARRAYVEPTITPLGTAESAQAAVQGGSL